MEDEKRKNVPTLPALMGFTDADLKLNREGLLSKKQLQHLRSSLIGMGIGYGFVIAFELFLIGMALLLIVLPLTSKGAGSQGLIGILSGIGLLVVTGAALPGSVATLWDFYHNATNDMKAEAAAEIIGPLYRYKELRSKQTYYKLNVEGVDFEISKGLYDYLFDGDVYRFYYSPLTLILLAAEPLAETHDEVLIEEEQAFQISA